MTTIDFHVHAPTRRRIWDLDHYDSTAYLETMNAAGVDIAVVLPLDGLLWGIPESNDNLQQWCAQPPGRYVPFGTVDARLPGSLDEMDRCVQELGMRGFKFHPWMQGFYVLDEQWKPVFERARDLGVPVILHDGTPPDSTPLQVAQLAIEVPGLQVILGHGGLHDLWPEAIEATRLAPSVFVCMTSLPYGIMQRIVDSVPPEQLLFGSDGGCVSPAYQSYVVDRWDDFRSVEMSAASRAMILTNTPSRLLRLEEDTHEH